jgi:hypothetical protein
MTRILETKDPVNEVMTLYSNLDSSAVKRNLSLLNINPDFTEESLARLLKTDVVARKIFKDDNRSWNNGDTIEADIGRLLLLRAFLHASANVIERILMMKGGLHSLGTGNLSGYGRTELLRGVIAVEEYIRSIRCNGRCRTTSNFDDAAREIDILSITTLNPTVPYDIAIRGLSQRYGSQIHFAQYGWYLIRIEKSPQEIVSIRDRISRTRSYMPVPCFFRVAGNTLKSGEGAVLVPIDIADYFWNSINPAGTNDQMVAIYFWYHGKNFRFFKIPPGSIDYSHDIIEQIEAIANYRYPEIMKIKKEHILDRIRKHSRTSTVYPNDS